MKVEKCPNCGTAGQYIEFVEDLDYNTCWACMWTDRDDGGAAVPAYVPMPDGPFDLLTV